MEKDFAELSTQELEAWISNERKEVLALRDWLARFITEYNGKQQEESNGSVS